MRDNYQRRGKEILTLNSRELEAVWEPVKRKILRLVETQIKKATTEAGRSPGVSQKWALSPSPSLTKALKIILLAGGLGESTYLFKVLEGTFLRQGIRVIKQNSPLPWSSICRGGVHRARQELRHMLPLDLDESELTEGVITRKARQSYGIAKYEDFVNGKHPPQDRYEMRSVGRVVAVNQMSWYLRIVCSPSDMFTLAPHY